MHSGSMPGDSGRRFAQGNVLGRKVKKCKQTETNTF